MTHPMQIGELAKKVGLNPPTIRYYEKEGLLPGTQRSDVGYRLYTEKDRETLEFIKTVQGLGLTLNEAKKMLKARVIRGKACDHVVQLLQDKIRAFEQKADELKEISRLMKGELKRWQGKKGQRKTCICDDIARAAKSPCSPL